MSPLIGILAQLITVGVSDRTEARAVVSGDKYAEVATTPRAGINFGWKHATLSLGYGVSLTGASVAPDGLTLIVFQNAFLAASYRWSRTTLTVSESVGYGNISFRNQAAAGALIPGAVAGTQLPTAPVTPGTGGTGTTGTGTPAPQPPVGAAVNPNQIRASVRVLRYVTSVTNVGFATLVSPVLVVGGGVGYLITGTVGAEKVPEYPLVKGPVFQAYGSYSLDRSNDLRTSISTQYLGALDGTNAWYGFASEAWGHRFSAQTQSQVSAGMSVTRNSRPDGLVALSFFPTVGAQLTRTVPAGRGQLSYGVNAAIAPAIDPVNAYVDPRFGFGGNVSWSKDRFGSALAVGVGLPVHTSSGGAELNSFYSTLTLGYRLGAGFAVDTGVRGFWQTVGRAQTVPPLIAVFAGLTYGAFLPLN
ncbi:MAG: hypothetical protein ABIQ16_03850 [Polyangiaceae bacterium]